MSESERFARPPAHRHLSSLPVSPSLSLAGGDAAGVLRWVMQPVAMVVEQVRWVMRWRGWCASGVMLVGDDAGGGWLGG